MQHRNVVVDTALMEAAALNNMIDKLAGYNTYFIGVKLLIEVSKQLESNVVTR